MDSEEQVLTWKVRMNDSQAGKRGTPKEKPDTVGRAHGRSSIFREIQY
ncbi:hypothetical protein HMPREF9412_4551 [Paenibacillus sp. HGF5]|nr:hypothetical protein HMPREF9412_4551 [Paenibacillus sp. HGF5]